MHIFTTILRISVQLKSLQQKHSILSLGNLPQSWSHRTHVLSRKKPKAIGPGIDPITLAMQTCKIGKGQDPRLMTRQTLTMKQGKTTCKPIAKECSESRTDRRQATTMGIRGGRWRRRPRSWSPWRAQGSCTQWHSSLAMLLISEQKVREEVVL